MKKSIKNLTTTLLFSPLVLAYFALSQMAQAAPDVNPPPDGAYSGGNTAEGQQALFSRTTGIYNNAIGIYSLLSLTTASFNTGDGAGTLLLNNANENTATGAGALLFNNAPRNTADGAFALFFNTTGVDNTAVGDRALQSNDSGTGNTAVGSGALFSNTTGNANSAFGFNALFSNTEGDSNVAIGVGALGQNTTGNDNIALGYLSGSDLTAGDNNIYIGNVGVANESNTIRIGDPAIHQNVFIGGIPAGGLAAILFDYNSGNITIGVGGPVPFNQTALQVGTAITKTDNETFTLNQDGVYRVTYTLRTALVSLLAQTQVQVNSTGVGPTAALVAGGVPLNDQVTFPANAGDTVQLVVGGLALTLATGDNATINIDKIQ
jgi:trimeric autotransporter adhesin